MRLSGLAGVHSVAVDLDARTVAVTHDEPADAVLAALDELDLDSHLVDHRAASMLPSGASPEARTQRSALVVALLLNAAFFVVELAAGLVSGSMGLVADSIDMLADASVYGLSLVAVGRAVQGQKRLARSSGYVQLGLAVAGLVEVVRRVVVGEPAPDVVTMVVVSALALAANIIVLLVLRRARGEGAHLRAAWIFTSNDIKVNALVIAAALLVMATGRAAPDLVVGAVIFAIVAHGARRILRLSR
jgi:Co/Zn/Cd efflux system component